MGHKEKVWRERADFLEQKYDPECWYWELVDMTRKLLLSGFLLFIAPGTIAQPTVGVLIALTFLLLHTRFTPLKLPALDVISFVSQLSTLLLLLFAVADAAGAIDELGVSEEVVNVGIALVG